MSSTLKDAINSLKTLKKPKAKGKVSKELLGRYADIIPKGKTSTEFVRELRSLRYKVKK